jgi:hypothetical protein
MGCRVCGSACHLNLIRSMVLSVHIFLWVSLWQLVCARPTYIDGMLVGTSLSLPNDRVGICCSHTISVGLGSCCGLLCGVHVACSRGIHCCTGLHRGLVAVHMTDDNGMNMNMNLLHTVLSAGWNVSAAGLCGCIMPPS